MYLPFIRQQAMTRHSVKLPPSMMLNIKHHYPQSAFSQSSLIWPIACHQQHPTHSVSASPAWRTCWRCPSRSVWRCAWTRRTAEWHVGAGRVAAAPGLRSSADSAGSVLPPKTPRSGPWTPSCVEAQRSGWQGRADVWSLEMMDGDYWLGEMKSSHRIRGYLEDGWH